MPLLSAESRKQRGHHLSGVAAERIIAAADAPVVQKSAFYYRVGLNYVVGGKVGAEDSLVLSLYGYLAERLVSRRLLSERDISWEESSLPRRSRETVFSIM